MLSALPRWVLRHAALISICGTLLAGWAGVYSVKLFANLRTDIEELLPTTARSVLDLNEVTSRLESVDGISVIIFSKNAEASRRFVTDLAQRLEKFPSDRIAYVEYRIDRELEFFKKRRPLYIETSDLLNIQDFIEQKIDYEKSLYNPFNIFSSIEIPEPQLDLQALKKKYEDKVSVYSRYPGGYYASPDETIRLIQVYLPGKFSGIHAAHSLRDAVDQSIREVDPSRYSPDITIKFAGGVQNLIEEHASLIADLSLSTILTCIIVAVIMLVYYRSVPATLALVLSLFMGVFWTFGASYFAVGYLNANSAFMASIVIGNGINFGIIFLARYLEERRRRRGHERAIYCAMTKTFGATVVAAGAAGLSYGSLTLTSFRGFSQFGIIGLIGMSFCWLSAYTLLPAYLSVFENLGLFKRTTWKEHPARIAKAMAHVIGKFPRGVVFTSVAVSLFSVIMLLRITPAVLETDLTKLRDKKSMESGSGYNARYVDAVLQRYGTPLVFLPHTQEESRAIADQLHETQKKLGASANIDIITHVDDFLPRDQDRKIRIFTNIKNMLTPAIRSRMSRADQNMVDQFLTPEAFTQIQAKDLPELILKKIREKDGSIGKLVLIEPPVNNTLKNGNDLISFIALLRSVADSVRPGIPVAGQLAVSADMIHAIRLDGPKATFFAFVAVLVLVALLFRRIKTIAVCLIALLLGILWMIGFMEAFQWKINFLNFIALPITFGIGVDYGVNIFQRWAIEGRTQITRVITHTGSAVGLASLTTIIGYASLLIASNQAFVSFGRLAVLGEITCLAAALFTLPAVLRWRELALQDKVMGWKSKISSPSSNFKKSNL